MSSLTLLRRSPFLALIFLISCIIANSNYHGGSSSSFVASAADTASSSATTTTTTQQQKTTGVIKLDAKNFDSSLRDGKVWLIEFYAPWCGHCTRFASTYEQVANQLHSKQKTTGGQKRMVNVAKVDGAAERAISSRFGVNSFPTFVLVDGWTVYEFEGARSQEALVQFALTEYKDIEPVPFLFGPFGPMGQTRSLMMRTGTWAVGLYDKLTQERGLKPLMAMCVLCVGGLVAGMVSIIVLGILFLPKAKLD